MVALADKARFRRALGYIGDVIADLMEATVNRSPRLAALGEPTAIVLERLSERGGMEVATLTMEQAVEMLAGKAGKPAGKLTRPDRAAGVARIDAAAAQHPGLFLTGNALRAEIKQSQQCECLFQVVSVLRTLGMSLHVPAAAGAGGCGV